MARNQRRNRRNRRKGKATLTQAAIGPRAVDFAKKHSRVDIAQITTPGANQSHCWAKLEDASVFTDRRVSTDRSRNWYDAARRWESESLRDLDSGTAIVWGTPAMRRINAERMARGLAPFATPERRKAGKPYTKYEGR